jgi:hypothetical protein
MPGQRIEYVIQALSKLYTNPLTTSMTHEALEQFQWLSQTSVQVVQPAFAVVQNTHDSAVEDTRYEVGLECVDPMSRKEWMILLMKVWPRDVGALYVDHKSQFVDADTMLAFVIKRESVDKPTGGADNLYALSSRDHALAMQALLQDDPVMFDQIYQSEGVSGLLTLVRAPIECYRCKGAHCKWQCPDKPSVEEKKGERDPRKWGLVPMCTLEPSKVLPRSVFALSGLVSTVSEVPAQALVSTSLEEMRTDMSSLIQEVKGSRDDVEGALNALTNMAGSLNALALAVQALQH